MAEVVKGLGSIAAGHRQKSAPRAIRDGCIWRRAKHSGAIDIYVWHQESTQFALCNIAKLEVPRWDELVFNRAQLASAYAWFKFVQKRE